MATALPTAPLLRPDREFVEAVMAAGGGDLKRCFQCATCSVVCDLSGENGTFPRRQMLWAQWGLKERLFSDPGIWLCHRCGDCSERCPRAARPGDVMAAVRRMVMEHHAVPRSFASLVNRPWGLPAMLVVPAVLLTAAVLLREPLGAALGMEPHAPAEGFSFAAFLPHWLLVGFFSLFAGLAAAAAAAGAWRFWRGLEAAAPAAGTGRPVPGIPAALYRVLRSALVHEKFARCGVRRSARATHMMVVYGFLALFATTVWAVIDLYLVPLLGGKAGYPYGPFHPVKFLANAGAILLVVGAGRALLGRFGESAVESSTAFDLNFSGLLLGVGLTGIALEVLRFSAGAEPGRGFVEFTIALYLVHLTLVFGLLVYLPYSKFAHVIYRTVALVHAERVGGRRGASGNAVAAGAAPGTKGLV